ncbi:MAG: hypothetical protein IPI67_33485 [Myxococcales bacterium]|nr:hypothetical protein [Myxococcales bacterium]
MMIERRVRRSERRDEALGFQLEAATERAGLDYCMLASHEGLVVACTPGDREESEEIAAQLAVLNLDPESSGEIWGASKNVTARAFDVDGERFIVGAAGYRARTAAREIEQMISGIARILR